MEMEQSKHSEMPPV
jgi:hypothetical protein